MFILKNKFEYLTEQIRMRKNELKTHNEKISLLNQINN